MTNETTFKDALAALLWDHLHKVPGHPDRRMTAWGSKTEQGLAECVKRIVEETGMRGMSPPVDREIQQQAVDMTRSILGRGF